MDALTGPDGMRDEAYLKTLGAAVRLALPVVTAVLTVASAACAERVDEIEPAPPVATLVGDASVTEAEKLRALRADVDRVRAANHDPELAEELARTDARLTRLEADAMTRSDRAWRVATKPGVATGLAMYGVALVLAAIASRRRADKPR